MKRFVCVLLILCVALGLLSVRLHTASPEPSANKEGIARQAMDSGNIQYYFMTSNGVSVGYEHYTTRWGDSCLIAFPDGKLMLIDTGLDTFYPILKDHLEKLYVSTIDYLVITHPHNDHCGGAWHSLFDDFTIGHVYHNGAKNLSWQEASHITAIAEKYNVPCTLWKAGDTMQLGKPENPVNLQVLWPTPEAMEQLQPIDTTPAINNLSLVIRFDYGAHSALFTGDVYQTLHHRTMEEQVPGCKGAEDTLLELYQNGELDVDLLKLPHHGNPLTSASAQFLSVVSPKYSVATSFEPVGQYLKYYIDRGMHTPVFFDRLHGQIRFQASAEGTLTPQVERNDYLEGFGPKWNDNEKMKK